MSLADIVLVATSVVTVAGSTGAVLWERRRDRNKPDLDEAELKKMVDETNSYRDFRIWQLEGYLDLDREWHRKVVFQFQRLVDSFVKINNGELSKDEVAKMVSTFALPDPPAVPEPPRRTG